MLQSVRRRCIRFAASEGCFKFKNRGSLPWPDPEPTAGEVSLGGVRDVLRLACFPNYRYDDALGDSGTGQFASQRVSTGLRAPHHGAARGRDVHDQLAVYVNRGASEWRHEFGASCSPYVTRIVEFLRQRGLVPVVAEFQDYFTDVDIGSSIDLMCRDTENGDGVALIELKVGGENYFEKSNGQLTAPSELRHFSNSPRNQALLQLLVYRAMITQNYPYIDVTRCFVLQARTDSLVVYGLTRPFIDAQNSLVDALKRRRQFEKDRSRRAAAPRGRGWPRAPPSSTRGAAASRGRW